jgi:hypothetical protein
MAQTTSSSTSSQVTHLVTKPSQTPQQSPRKPSATDRWIFSHPVVQRTRNRISASPQTPHPTSPRHHGTENVPSCIEYHVDNVRAAARLICMLLWAYRAGCSVLPTLWLADLHGIDSGRVGFGWKRESPLPWTWGGCCATLIWSRGSDKCWEVGGLMMVSAVCLHGCTT